MRKRQKSFSIRNKMFLLMLALMLILTMIVSVVAYWYTYITFKHETETDIENSVIQVQRSVDDIFYQSEVVNAFVFIDAQAQVYMDSDAQIGHNVELMQELSELVLPFRYAMDYIQGMGFYSQRANEFLFMSNGSGISIYERADRSELCDFIDAMNPAGRGMFFQRNESRTQFSLYIINKNRNGSGAVVLNVNLLKLREAIAADEKTRDYIISEDGTVIYSENKEEMGEKYTDISLLADWKGKEVTEQRTILGKRSVISSVKSERYDWYYVSIRDLSEFHVPMGMLSWVWSMVAICVILGIVYALFISRKSSQPLEKVLDMLNDKVILEKKYSHEELRMIAQKLAGILNSNRELQASLEEKMQEFGNLQNKALQYQINPHFLFNTLNLVGTVAAKEYGMKNEVFGLVMKLSRILRYSLEVDRNLVPLKRELEYVRLYIDILEKRHAGILTVNYDIPEELLEKEVLRLSLQPLIENAVYHGIQPRGGGILSISAARVDKDLLLCVGDNGVGMGQPELNALNERIHQNPIRSEHIGLANVHRRLQILFGEPYGVTVVSTEGKGTEVVMRLPCYQWEDDENI